MKKFLSLFFGSLIVLLMFAAPGASVKAADTIIFLGGPSPVVEHPDNDNCECHKLVPLSGSERNKIVSNLLKSEVFKNEKMNLKKAGYKWDGASGIEVVKPTDSVTLVGVPFIASDGTKEIDTFFIGDFKDFIEYMESIQANEETEI